MIDEYGDNIKLYKCLKDNIIFYNKETFSSDYLNKCPICKLYICYYCSISFNLGNPFGKCCIRRRINYILFEGGPENANNEDFIKKEDYLFFIPFINFLYFISGIFMSFFSQLLKHGTKKNEYENLLSYEQYLENKSKKIYLFLFSTIILFGITLMIPFIILDIYIIIFLLFISIPFKFYPIKYIFAILVVSFKT